ncbi:hypothetical protein HN419_06480 [Candidatus Woesearchaeota archaeon]|jgi:hypothetical protein|nr:hypothetical protein [Candidatus Woesearchaeota archaeon]MBT3538141.1 hypothetical protein [Candidatus Woesearchaeota archaeon]MBT4697500.1 hypothetical protein [Candidatus Woesearchaeota archaeon]MBT4716856.1 hypothetical protein [Candidatus Woesearchaeota archaeon]MBT7105810.1 hypothetical protein [Candidatus Woesearchaeota archaeon]
MAITDRDDRLASSLVLEYRELLVNTVIRGIGVDLRVAMSEADARVDVFLTQTFPDYLQRAGMLYRGNSVFSLIFPGMIRNETEDNENARPGIYLLSEDECIHAIGRYNPDARAIYFERKRTLDLRTLNATDDTTLSHDDLEKAYTAQSSLDDLCTQVIDCLGIYRTH